MSSLIPPTLESWTLDVLNTLIPLKDIEGERFDFKGPEFKELSHHICAMANTAGGYLVLGIEQHKNPKTKWKGFRKSGFKVGTESNVEIQINNGAINIEPFPKINFKYIYESKKFYAIIKVETILNQKPYFVKGAGVCYVRAGASTSPASRTTIMNLFTNLIQKRNSILRLRASCRELKEQIQYTSGDVQRIHAGDVFQRIRPLNLTFLQNAVLDTEWLFLENNLYGGHISEQSVIGGYYSFYDKLERLNLAIQMFNQDGILKNREGIKRDQMRFWHPSGQDAKDAILFLQGIITRCDNFISNLDNE